MWLVGPGIMAATVFKNRQESPWDAILKKLVSRLIRMLVRDWAQKIFLCSIRGQHLSRCFRDLEFICKLDYWP